MKKKKRTGNRYFFLHITLMKNWTLNWMNVYPSSRPCFCSILLSDPCPSSRVPCPLACLCLCRSCPCLSTRSWRSPFYWRHFLSLLWVYQTDWQSHWWASALVSPPAPSSSFPPPCDARAPSSARRPCPGVPSPFPSPCLGFLTCLSLYISPCPIKIINVLSQRYTKKSNVHRHERKK